MKKVEAFIFDLDGVITDTAHYHFKAWQNLAKQVGISIDEAFNEKLKGISRIESLTLILAHGGILNRYTSKEIEVLANQKNQEYVTYLADMQSKDIYPGILQLLKDIKASGRKIALASASKNAPQILEALNITEYFDYIVDPEEVVAGKPAPDIFLRGAQAVGANPENCVGIEDAVSGIQAILAAKMFAIGVGTKQQMEAAGANLVVSDTSELVLDKLLEQIG